MNTRLLVRASVALMLSISATSCCELLPKVCQPPPPKDLVATPISATEVMLKWSHSGIFLPAPGFNRRYNIERRLSSDEEFSSLAETSENAISYVDDGCVPGTNYRYRIRAANEYGVSDWVGVSAATPDVSPDVSVSIVRPGEEQQFSKNDIITLEAVVTDDEGHTVELPVEWYEGGDLLGTGSIISVDAMLDIGVRNGVSVTAVVEDTRGARATSTVTFDVLDHIESGIIIEF